MPAVRYTVAVLLVMGCSQAGAPVDDRVVLNPDDPSIPVSGSVVGIEIMPGLTYVSNIGVPGAFVANGVTVAGIRVALTDVRWFTSANEVLAVDSLKGTYVVMRDGTATVTAKWQGFTYAMRVTADYQCRGPAVYPAGPTRLRVGEQAHWTAHVSTCEPVPGDVPRFSSSDSTVLSMTADGFGVAKKAGLATVSVRMALSGQGVSVAVYVDP